jgi:hypothetical protein
MKFVGLGISYLISYSCLDFIDEGIQLIDCGFLCPAI